MSDMSTDLPTLGLSKALSRVIAVSILGLLMGHPRGSSIIQMLNYERCSHEPGAGEMGQLNNVLRQAGWGQGEIDSAAYTFDKMAEANRTLIKERDTARQDAARLREALEALWRLTENQKIQDLDAHAIIEKALKGA